MKGSNILGTEVDESIGQKSKVVRVEEDVRKCEEWKSRKSKTLIERVQKFEDLRIWQEARQLVVNVYSGFKGIAELAIHLHQK